MPIQIWTQDQVPNLMVAGKTALGRGLGAGIEEAGNALKEFKERDKREADELKRERALSKMFKDELGLSDAEIEGLDAHTLRGMNEGYLLQNSQAHQAALTELSRANTKLAQQRMAFDALREAQGEAASRVPGEILRQAGAGIPSPLSNESYDEELAKRTGMSPAALSLLRGYQAAGAALPQSVVDDLIRGGAANDFAPSVKTLNGHEVIYSPKTGAFQLPAPLPNAPGAGILRVATDEEGNEIPGVYITGKGAPWQVKPGKPKREPGEGPKESKDGKFYWDDNTQSWKPIHADLMDAFKQILEDRTGGAKPAASAPAKPVLRYRMNAKGEMEEY